MKPNRVILANEPRLLRGMLRRVIAKAPGLQVAGEEPDLADLAGLVDEWDAQWIIVSIWPEGLMPEALRSLLIEHRSLGVLGMASDCSRIKVACNGSIQIVQEGLSLDDLIAILNRESE